MKTRFENPFEPFRPLMYFGISEYESRKRQEEAKEREEQRRQEQAERDAKTDAFRARSLELQEMRLQNQAQNIELGFERDQTARDKNDIDRYKAVTDRFHKGEQDSIAHSKLALGYDQLGEKMREHDDTMAFKYYDAERKSEDARYKADLNSEDRLLKLDLNDARQGYEYDMAFNAMFPSPSPSLDLEDTFGEDYNMFWD